MLSFKRRVGESIVIDPRTCPKDELGLIRVTLWRGKGGLSLATEAPRAVKIVRGELWELLHPKPETP